MYNNLFIPLTIDFLFNNVISRECLPWWAHRILSILSKNLSPLLTFWGQNKTLSYLLFVVCTNNYQMAAKSLVSSHRIQCWSLTPIPVCVSAIWFFNYFFAIDIFVSSKWLLQTCSLSILSILSQNMFDFKDIHATETTFLENHPSAFPR